MALVRASVEEVYKKNKEIRKEDVKMILEWLKKEPHLPKLTELEVAIFLYRSDFNIEQSKKIIDLHFSYRTHLPEVFGNRTISDNLRKQMDATCCHYLPGLTPNGSSVIFMRLMGTDVDNFGYTEHMKLFFMILDLHLIRTGPTKYVFLIDMEGMQWAHVAKMNLVIAKKVNMYMLDGINIKLIGFHHINSVSFIDKIMALMKKLAKQEFLDKIQFYAADNVEGVYEYIPKKMMPKNYGGEAPSYEELHEMMNKDIIANADFFKEEELTRRVNEALRPGGPKNAIDFFGPESSFKNLDFD